MADHHRSTYASVHYHLLSQGSIRPSELLARTFPVMISDSGNCKPFVVAHQETLDSLIVDIGRLFDIQGISNLSVEWCGQADWQFFSQTLDENNLDAMLRLIRARGSMDTIQIR
jgi:hypothetical protein